MNSSHRDIDEARSVGACLRGDTQAQRELVDRYSGLCRHVAVKILGATSGSHVDDVVQEILTAVFKDLARWRGENLPAWIGTIAARRAIDYRRWLQRSGDSVSSPLNGQLGDLKPDSGGPDATAMVDLLDAVRRQLSNRQRAILNGMLAGRSRREVADEADVSQRTLYYELGAIEDAVNKVQKTSAEDGLS